jgi:hypothetical protein
MPREVLLIEPNYKNKYPPLGLMKIATYYKLLGDNVRFYKGELKDFVAELLCDDLLRILMAIEPDTDWRIFIPSLTRFIRYGKKEDFPNNKMFDNLFVKEKVNDYRIKFKTEDYFKSPRFDVVGVTTLFTFHWKITIETINFVKKLCKDESCVFVGGVASTIVPDYIEKETGIRPITGILDSPGVLDADNEIIIDTLPLDYSILHEIDYKYPASDAYFAYMTRGCVNNCKFCAVSTLEPEYCGYVQLQPQLEATRERFGEQQHLLLLDNNVLASTRFDNIIDEIVDCGFGHGATYLPPNPYTLAISNLKNGINDRAYVRICVDLYRNLIEKCNNINICRDEKIRDEVYKRIVDSKCNLDYTATKEAILELDEFISPIYEKYAYRPMKRQRYVDFNQGIDARLITPQKMARLAEINIRPLRIAFDQWSMRRAYETAVREAAAAGITNLSNYLLYNYTDKPIDLYRRMKRTIELCDELGVVIYSFPMKYHPIDDPNYFRNREYIGKYWCRKYIRAVQAVLTATHGKIGRGTQFFEAAFGHDELQFEEILNMPEVLIIRRFEHDSVMRERYPEYARSDYIGTTTDEWRHKYYALSDSDRKTALRIIKKNIFTDAVIEKTNEAVQSVLRYYQLQRG